MRNSSPQNWKWMGRSSHRSSGFTCQPSVVLVIAMRRLLQGKAPIERERASSRSHQPVLECSFRKGRPGERLLHRLRFDESEVIDPQPSTWPQHPVEFSQGLLEFKPMMHADGLHHRVKGLIRIGEVCHITALEMHPLLYLLTPGMCACQPDHIFRQVDAVDLKPWKPSGKLPD